VSSSELLEVADPALGQQRDRLLRADHGPEAGVAVRGDQARHEQRMPQAARGGDVARAGSPGGALQADHPLVRPGDVEQVVEVFLVDRLADRDQDLGALASGLDRLGGDVRPVGDAGVQVVQDQ